MRSRPRSHEHVLVLFLSAILLFALFVANSITSVTRAAGPLVASDQFERTVVNGWGDLDSGGSWLPTNGNDTSFSVNGGVGHMLHTAIGPTMTELKARVPDFSSADVDIRADFRAQAAPDDVEWNGIHQFILYSRYEGPPDFRYYLKLVVEFSNAAPAPTMRVDRQATEFTQGIANGLASGPNDSTVWWTVRFQTIGDQIRAKAWPTGTAEPAAWGIDFTDSGVMLPNQFGVGTYSNDVTPAVTFDVDNVLVTDETPAATPFTDISSSPFKSEIEWLYGSGITSGCSPTLFCPTGSVTREQMASFLVRALGLPSTTQDFFTDDDSSIHQADINRLAAAGVTGGCGPGIFCPGSNVTREQMASFLVRGFDLASAPTDYFVDDETSIHEADINSLAQSGITGGCGPGIFCPGSNVTREQMAAFLYRAMP